MSRMYRTLMRSRHCWQKTLGVMTCKTLRARENATEFGKIYSLLSSRPFLRFVERADLHLAFTGGTYDDLAPALRQLPVLHSRLFRMAPSALGVIQLANLVVYGHLRAILFFNHLEDPYADSPQNFCLRRICNQYDTALFEEYASIEYILHQWSSRRALPRGRTGHYPVLDIDGYFGKGDYEDIVLYRGDLPAAGRQRDRETLAVVAHNERKMTMLNFCLRHMAEILSYRRVLTTGTTGARLRDQYGSALAVLQEKMGRAAFRRLPWTPRRERIDDFLTRKIQQFKSGPHGGDVQISAKVIDGTCHRVLFFQDPQTAHPHQYDIRLMEKAVQDPVTAALLGSTARTAEMIV